MKSHKVHIHAQSFSVTRVNRSDYYSDITDTHTQRPKSYRYFVSRNGFMSTEMFVYIATTAVTSSCEIVC